MRLALVLACALAACGGGARPGGARGVADRFVDLYFVEIDQRAALPITDGPARVALEKELADTEAVRQGGYTAADAMGRVYWENVYAREEAGALRAIYDLTFKHGRDATRRHVMLTVRRKDGAWRVTSFTVKDGPAPRPR